MLYTLKGKRNKKTVSIDSALNVNMTKGKDIKTRYFDLNLDQINQVVKKNIRDLRSASNFSFFKLNLKH